MMSPRSDPALVRESEELLRDCVNMDAALLACPSLTARVIRKAALYGSVRTPARGLYYLPDLRVLEKRKWRSSEG